MERKLPTAAELAESGYLGYNTDVPAGGKKSAEKPAENKAVAGPAANKSAAPAAEEMVETVVPGKKSKKRKG